MVKMKVAAMINDGLKRKTCPTGNSPQRSLFPEIQDFLAGSTSNEPG